VGDPLVNRTANHLDVSLQTSARELEAIAYTLDLSVMRRAFCLWSQKLHVSRKRAIGVVVPVLGMLFADSTILPPFESEDVRRYYKQPLEALLSSILELTAVGFDSLIEVVKVVAVVSVGR
jgi:hypothetical protein